MTQQPYYGTPQDPYNPQPAQQYPPAGYQQVPNGYAPAPNPYQPAPQYGPPPGQYPGQQNPQHQVPQGPPAPVGAKGTVGEFFKQPTPGGGKGVSWKNKPDGYTYVGVVNRTPGDGDLFQDSDPQTKQLKTWRDGSPRMVMPVPLDLVPMDAWQAQEYADGEARVFLRGEMLTEFTRAMSEVGLPEGTVPQKGALVFATITGRKPGRGTMPANQYRVVYLPAGTWEQDPQYAGIVQHLAGRQAQQHAPATQPAPYQQQASPVGNYAPQTAAPAGAQPNPQQYAQPPYGAAPAYDPNQYQQAPAQPIYQAAPQGQYSSQAQAAPVQYAPNPQQYAQPDSQPPVAAPAQPAYDFSQHAQQVPVQGQLPGMPPTPPQAPPSAGAVGAPDPHKAALIAQLQNRPAAPNPQQ